MLRPLGHTQCAFDSPCPRPPPQKHTSHTHLHPYTPTHLSKLAPVALDALLDLEHCRHVLLLGWHNCWRLLLLGWLLRWLLRWLCCWLLRGLLRLCLWLSNRMGRRRRGRGDSGCLCRYTLMLLLLLAVCWQRLSWYMLLLVLLGGYRRHRLLRWLVLLLLVCCCVCCVRCVFKGVFCALCLANVRV